MPERPLLIHPYPENVDIAKGHGGGKLPPLPVMGATRKRKFSDKFQAAINYIQSIAGQVDPEMVLVIETIGNIQDFQKAVQNIEGLEWLGESDRDELEIDDDVYENDADREEAKKKGGRLYLISSNKSGLDKIHSLWKRHCEGENLGRGYAKWRGLFKYINDIRHWNEKDRVEETGVWEYWQNEINVKRDTDSEIWFGIEFHFRKSDKRAEEITRGSTETISRLDGQVVKTVRIPEIGFHALKVFMPTRRISEIVRRYTDGTVDSYMEQQESSSVRNIIMSDAIKYFRPIPQQLATEDDEIPQYPEDMEPQAPDEKPPVIALLDGFPMTNHYLLKDWLIVDDPDSFENTYNPGQQKHGTPMASLICHDDLDNTERESLSRKIYVRPVMRPHDELSNEQIPPDEFPEDLLERAMVRIFEGQGESIGVAPTIRIVNLSLGNLDHLFLGEMSSWARLLDWLSWKYKVLFVVSAGNYSENDGVDNSGQLDATIKGMSKTIRNRKILSPAESINALTVGALHSDHSTISSNDTRIDILQGEKLMAEYSRLGSGYRRTIKPDILAPGGRQLFIKENSQTSKTSLKRDNRREPPGQKFAYVGASSEDVKNTGYGRGTSNSAAITTHVAGLIYEVIEELRSTDSERIPEKYESVLLKSLLVHSASWGGMQDKLEVLKTPKNSRKFKRVLSQYIGYGATDFSRVMECTAQRVTMIGWGEIGQRTRHLFTLPVPDPCKGIHYKLATTLAYFTPINPFHFNYRKAKVFFECRMSRTNRQEADHQQVQGGTVQHEILDLQGVDSDIEIFVQCNADATESLDEEIPYALSLTLEAKEETLFDIDIDIYEEIRQQIEISVAATQ